MGIITRIKKLFTKQLLTSQYYGSPLYYAFGNYRNWLGGNCEKNIKDGYLQNEIIYSATNIYLNKIKVAPIILSRVVSEKHLSGYNQFLQSKEELHRPLALKYRNKALEEVTSHPLLTLLNKPNERQSRSEFLEEVFGYYKLLGEAFVYGMALGADSSRVGQFNELYVLPAHLVNVKVTGEFPDYQYDYSLIVTGREIKLVRENVMHFKNWNPIDLGRGLSPISVAIKTLTADSYNIEAQVNMFENGGSAYLLSAEPSNGIDTPVTREQMELLNQAIKDKIKGVKNIGNIVATSAATRVQKIGDTPADLKLLEARGYNRGVLSTLIGVDPILLGDKANSSYNNQQEAKKGLITDTVIPDLISFRDKLTSWLLPRYRGQNLYIDFDTTVYAELQPDLKLMKEVYGNMWQITPNELRSIFNWDTVDNPLLDEFYIPSGLTPLSDNMLMQDFNNNNINGLTSGY